MISVIAFDYGGVIEISEKNIVQEIVRYLGIQKEEWSNAYFSLNNLCNTGEHSWTQVMVITAEKVGATPEQILNIENLLQLDTANKKLNLELIEKIRSLKPKYKIALTSNYAASLRQKLIDQGVVSLFDEIIISGEVGHQKPQPEIFNLLCERMHIKTSELVFIDDTQRSLEGADKIGYTPILYTNNQKLFEDLSKILDRTYAQR